MKQGRTLSDLASEIERQCRVKKDYIADTKALVLTNDAKLTIIGNGEALPVNPIAHRQLAERIGIPAKYYEKMRTEAPELLAKNVNHWFSERPERRMVRTLDGTVRAFLSDRYQRIDNYDVAKVALPVLKDISGIRTMATEITESRLYIKAVTSEVRAEVRSRNVGDVVEAGVMITNSEVGLGAITVKPFCLRLVCTNGMVRDKSVMRAAHVGRKVEADEITALLSDGTKRLEDMAVLSKVRDVIKAAFDETKFREWIDRMSNASEQEIGGDIPKVVELLAENYTLAADERSDVLKHLIQGGDLSRWGLANAVTRAAEDRLSFDRATELETVGGALIDLPDSEWRVLSYAK
jgi:hypothetical protein